MLINKEVYARACANSCIVNKLTRVLAWVYICVPLSLPVLIGLAVVVLTALSLSSSPADSLQQILASIKLPSTIGVIVLIWIAIVMVFVLPWIFLLKKRAWAWWLLIVWFALLTLVDILNVIDGRHGSYVAPLALVTLAILLADGPWGWKSRSKATRKRRKSYSRRRRPNSSRSR